MFKKTWLRANETTFCCLTYSGVCTAVCLLLIEGEQKLFGLTFLSLEAISKARAFQSIKITRLLLNIL